MTCRITKLLFAYNRPAALILNSFHFGNSCLTAKLSRGIDILQMLAYGRLLHAKQFRNLQLGQPNAFMCIPSVKTGQTCFDNIPVAARRDASPYPGRLPAGKSRGAHRPTALIIDFYTDFWTFHTDFCGFYPDFCGHYRLCRVPDSTNDSTHG